MRSRKPFLIFWLQYFDAKKSRSQGRRLPKKLAIEKISTIDITKAAQKLGYNVDTEQKLRYPRSWWENTGRVLINTKGKKKSKVILEIAKEIRKSQ